MAEAPCPTGRGEVCATCWQKAIGCPPKVKSVKPDPPRRTKFWGVAVAIVYYTPEFVVVVLVADTVELVRSSEKVTLT
jgi:hypothetical protein